MTAIPTQVTFRGLTPSDGLTRDIHERVAWLKHFSRDISTCHVLLEVPHRHQGHDHHFHVRVEVTVPHGDVIVVNHTPSLRGHLQDMEETAHHNDADIAEEHRCACGALHDAFDAARRQLQDRAREQRGVVEAHDTHRDEVVS